MEQLTECEVRLLNAFCRGEDNPILLKAWAAYRKRLLLHHREGKLVGGTVSTTAITLRAAGCSTGSVRGDAVVLGRQQRNRSPLRNQLGAEI